MNLPLLKESHSPAIMAPLPIDVEPAFLEEFEKKIKETIEKYSMISPDDKVVVAVSGGKDSTVLLHLLKHFGYNVSAVTVDAHIGCYSADNLRNIKAFCKELGVELYVASFNQNFGKSVCYITETLQNSGEKLGTCTVCGVLRRQLLNKAARELGVRKIALGHNMDDEVQAVLMNLFRNRQTLNARIGPNPGVEAHEGFVPRIKPLYFVSEKDITTYSKAKKFPVKYGECPCSTKSFRYSMKEFVKETEKDYPYMKENVLQFMLSKVKNLRKKQVRIAPQQCNECGEPSATSMCRACDILQKFKTATKVA